MVASFGKHVAWGQTVLPDKSILIRQKMMKNAKMEKLKCDILGDFQTLWPCCSSVTRQVNFKINGKCQNWKTFMRYFRWFSSTVPSCNRRLFEKSNFFLIQNFLAIWSTVISWHILQLRGKLAIFCAVAADFQIIDSASAWSRDVTL